MKLLQFLGRVIPLGLITGAVILHMFIHNFVFNNCAEVDSGTRSDKFTLSRHISTLSWYDGVNVCSPPCKLQIEAFTRTELCLLQQIYTHCTQIALTVDLRCDHSLFLLHANSLSGPATGDCCSPSCFVICHLSSPSMTAGSPYTHTHIHTQMHVHTHRSPPTPFSPDCPPPPKQLTQNNELPTPKMISITLGEMATALLKRHSSKWGSEKTRSGRSGRRGREDWGDEGHQLPTQYNYHLA